MSNSLEGLNELISSKTSRPKYVIVNEIYHLQNFLNRI